jgi:ATP-dependent DNA helicase RecG
MDLKKLIFKTESEIVEFKKSIGEWKEIIETISAFSNTRGGKIVIGVSKSGKLFGTDIGKDTIECLTNQISQNTDPKIYPHITVEKINSKSIITIEVKESPDHLVLAFGRPYKRVGKSTVRMSKDEYERLILEKHKEKLYFDSQICKGASLKDIDEEKIRWFLMKAKSERNLNIEPAISAKEALTRLKLITNKKLTNAAILLFGKETQRFFTQAEVRCARFKGTEAVKPFIDMKVFSENIIDQVNKTLNFILEHIPLSAWLTSGKVEREEKYEYPPEAIREAIVNAICHRDYKSTANVQVRIFDDRVEIWNPGSLPEGWTVEKLKQTHESIPKNPLIAHQFFLVRFIEKWGTGTIEMIKRCIEWGLPEPEFEFTGTSLVVNFKRSFFTDEILRNLGLNERQIKLLKDLEAQEFITSSRYEKMFNITDRQARMDLSRLVSLGLILKSGKARLTKYSSNPEISGNIRKLIKRNQVAGDLLPENRTS